jgi:hypothetical protein
MTVATVPLAGYSALKETPAPDQNSSFAWLRFQHAAVRDLAFALASPPLLAAWPIHLTPPIPVDLFSAEFWHSHYARYLPRLLALDLDPEPLETALASLSSTRLGVRFEALLSFWLTDKSADWHEFVLLAQNIQLKDHKRTIGEIDFLIHNQTTLEVEHWELSLKFYLGEARLAPFDWRGLNDRDSFGRKIKHTLSHQFNVSEIDHPTLGLITIQKRRAVFKGRLFYPDAPHSAAADLAATTAWLHPAHLRGTWGYDLPADYAWRRGARREWLTPTAISADAAPLRYLSHGLYLGYEAPLTASMSPRRERMVRVMPRRPPYRDAYYRRLFQRAPADLCITP